MNTHVKKIIGGVVLGIALAAHTVPTWAGLKTSQEVVVTTGLNSSPAGLAYGAISAARYSSDNRQFIGCYISGVGSSRSAGCDARDKNGTTFSCSTTDPNMINRVRSMTNYSYLTIYKSLGSNTCYSIEVTNESETLK